MDAQVAGRACGPPHPALPTYCYRTHSFLRVAALQPCPSAPAGQVSALAAGLRVTPFSERRVAGTYLGPPAMRGNPSSCTGGNRTTRVGHAVKWTRGGRPHPGTQGPASGPPAPPPAEPSRGTRGRAGVLPVSPTAGGNRPARPRRPGRARGCPAAPPAPPRSRERRWRARPLDADVFPLSRHARLRLGLDCCTFFFVRCIFWNKKKSPTLHTTSPASVRSRSAAPAARERSLPLQLRRDPSSPSFLSPSFAPATLEHWAGHKQLTSIQKSFLGK